MKQYIYVTKLKKQKLQVYFDKESSTFHYFKVQNEQLTETFPNELPIHIRYDAENNTFEISEKRKQCTKVINVLKSVVATLGVAITITSAYPKLVSLRDYTAMKKQTLFTTARLVTSKTSEEEYYELFRSQMEKNEYFTDEEKKIMVEGHINFLKDMGPLIDETQKEFNLYQAENMIVVEDSSIRKEGLAGKYSDGIITIRDRDDFDTLKHEKGHGLSDHGRTVGAISNKSGLGISLNEAITECVSSKYEEKNNSQYDFEQKIVFILSQIVGKDLLIKTYADWNTKIDEVIKEVCRQCPNTSFIEVIRFFIKWDKLQLDDSKVSPEDKEQLKSQVKELVNKFYKDKYGLDFYDTVFYTTWQNRANYFKTPTVSPNFLDKEFSIVEIKDDTTFVYSIPTELGNKKLEHKDYKDYLSAANSLIPIVNGLATKEELYECQGSLKSLIEILERKYSKDAKHSAKFELLKGYLKNRISPGTEEETIAFADLSFENVMDSYNDPKYVACRLKELTNYADFIFRSTFIDRISELLKTNNCNEVLYYYENTNIYWKTNDDSRVIYPPTPTNFYDEYEVCKDYILTNDGDQEILLVKVPVGKEPVHYYSTSLYKDVKWYKVSAEKLSNFLTTFNPGEGEYFCTFIDADSDFSGTIKIKNADDIPEEAYVFTK